jgi:hypothetical protein
MRAAIVAIAVGALSGVAGVLTWALLRLGAESGRDADALSAAEFGRRRGHARQGARRN